MTYYIQNRYQDSGWEYVDTGDPRPSTDLEATMESAAHMASDSIRYGMIRVIDENGRVIRTWSAGETSGQYDEPTDPMLAEGESFFPTPEDFQRDFMPEHSRLIATVVNGLVFVSVNMLDALLAEMQLNSLRMQSDPAYDALLQSLRNFLARVEQKVEAA